MRRHFNLSRNKSLRTLETTASSIATAGDSASGFLKTVLSTIKSPLPLDVVITYEDLNFDYRACPWTGFVRARPTFTDWGSANTIHQLEPFKVFGEMYRVRAFRLVLCADVMDCIMERAIQVLKSVVEVEMANGGLDYLLSEPRVISEIRSPRTRPSDDSVGWTGRHSIRASAL